VGLEVLPLSKGRRTFDEIRVKKEMSWNGSIKIVLTASDSGNNEFSLKCIDKRLDSNGAGYGKSGRKTSTTLSRKDVIPLIEILEACRLPPLPAGIDGCDGDIWTFTMISGLNRSQFRWWVEPPEKWQPLQGCADLLMRWCNF